MSKAHQYAQLILLQINEMFNEECENHIDVNDFEEGENLTEFMHALATIAPNYIFNKLTSEHKNHLEFNHIANQLVFQFAQVVKNEAE